MVQNILESSYMLVAVYVLKMIHSVFDISIYKYSQYIEVDNAHFMLNILYLLFRACMERGFGVDVRSRGRDHNHNLLHRVQGHIINTGNSCIYCRNIFRLFNTFNNTCNMWLPSRFAFLDLLILRYTLIWIIWNKCDIITMAFQ